MGDFFIIAVEVGGIGGIGLIVFYKIFTTFIKRSLFPKISTGQATWILIIYLSLATIVTIYAIWVFHDLRKPEEILVKTISRVSIKGKITEKNGEPIKGAQITIDSYDFKTISRENGEFMKILLKSGDPETLTVRVYTPEYISQSKDIFINANDKESIVTFELNKK